MTIIIMLIVLALFFKYFEHVTRVQLPSELVHMLFIYNLLYISMTKWYFMYEKLLTTFSHIVPLSN